MQDIVRTFEQYAITQGWQFEYGSKAHLNLLGNSEDIVDENGNDVPNPDGIDPDRIYLLMFPVTRDPVQNQLGTKFSGRSYSGKFFLVKKADIANHYFGELNNDPATSKYTKNIEPLVELHDSFGSNLLCGDIDLNKWSCIDAIDFLDANLDGVWCTFNVIQNE